MRTSILCGMAKVRRRKLPNLLLCICIMISSVILVNALVFWKESDAIFDRAYGEMNGPQLCCLWSKEMVSSDTVRQYLEHASEAFDYQITENTKTIDYIEKNGRKLSNGILLELPDGLQGIQASPKHPAKSGESILSPRILDESEPEMPGKNEVWVTAKTAGILNLKTGDELSLRLADASTKVKVVKIVSDPAFGGSNSNVYRMWCGHGRLSDFPPAGNHAVSYLEIRFNPYSPETEQRFIHKTEAHFQMPLGDTLYTYGQIKSGYTSVYKMAGALLCLVSTILSITVAALVLFLIKNDMDEDVRNIGIYKTLGMSGGQITGAYLVSYGIISAAGAASGSILGGWTSRKLLEKLLGDIGIYHASCTGPGIYPLLVWFLVMAMILAVCFCSVFKIYRLNASAAVRRGTWKADEKDRGVRESACCRDAGSFELLYAIRGIRNKKLRYLYIAGVSLIFGSLLTVCLGTLNAVGNIDKDPETWGFIRTDIYITSLADVPVSSIIDELRQDPRVDYTYGVNKVHTKYQPDRDGDWQSMTTELYELPWNEKIADKSLYGRRPRQEDEISVGLALAEKYGLRTGETMELFVNGEKKEYVITGIFQTLSNHGEIIRMVTDDLDRFKAQDNGFGDYMLVLSDSSDKWAYADELNVKYNGMFSFIASKSNGENITGLLVPAAGTILIILLIILVLVTTNLTVLLIRQDQKTIGLLKAVGMTSRQILKIYLWQNCLSAASGNLLGLATGTFLIPGLLDPFAKQLGLTRFPFAGSLAGMSAAGILLPGCIFLGTCAIVGMINKVSVKKLVD